MPIPKIRNLTNWFSHIYMRILSIAFPRRQACLGSMRCASMKLAEQVGRCFPDHGKKDPSPR
jgi:hypothetical protein